MSIRIVALSFAAVALAAACARPLPAKSAPSCDAGEEAVPVSQGLGAEGEAKTKWHCEPRCEPPKQRMTTFVGELGDVKAYEFACVSPCPLGKQLERSQRDLDTTTNYTYSCVAITPAPPRKSIAGEPTEQAEEKRSDEELAAKRFAEFRKEREEEAHLLTQTCSDPCAARVHACFRDPKSSGKTCVLALQECQEACRSSPPPQKHGTRDVELDL